MIGKGESSDIVISIARTEAEREQCFALRYRVYVEEQGRQPPSADHERRLDRNADDATGILFCARRGDALVGTLRLHHGAETGLPPFVRSACGLEDEAAALAQSAAVSRLAIDAAQRGGKAVVSLLRACQDWLRAEGRDTRQVYILAFDEPRLIAMYRLLGFRPLVPLRRYVTDLGPTVPMVSTLGAR